MKRLLAAAVLVSSVAFADAAAPSAPVDAPKAGEVHADLAPSGRPWRRNAVTVNPLGLAFNTIGIEYERAVLDNLSVFAAPSYSFGNKTSAFGLDLGAHFFPGGEGLRGFWVGAQGNLSYTPLSFTANGQTYVTDTPMGFGIGAQAGYTWLIADVFDISLGGGVQYTSFPTVDFINQSFSRYAGAWPSARFNIGYTF